MQTVPLFEERLTPVCAPDLLKENDRWTQVADLARHTLLHPTRDHRDWKMWQSLKVGETDAADTQGSIDAEHGLKLRHA